MCQRIQSDVCILLFSGTMNQRLFLFGICTFFHLMVLPEGQGQLTQSLGWGSAGSPGKRSSVVNFKDAPEFDPDFLHRVLRMLGVQKITVQFG